MKELAALAYRDTTQENRDFWKNEMGNAMREIQATYDDKLESMRGELETYYNMKVELRDYSIVSEGLRWHAPSSSNSLYFKREQTLTNLSHNLLLLTTLA